MSLNIHRSDEDDEYEDEDVDEDDQTDEEYDPAGGMVVADAPVYEQDEFRDMLGSVVRRLDDTGIDIHELADNAGLESTDVTALSNDDLATLTHYLAQNHPEVLQNIAGRYPATENILAGLAGEQGGFFGRMFGG